uniref:Sigma non-opioid intracellular receptor 1 n=1 Tax=Arion vulgaris TaxID=1028688 RepID=A0A0B6ZFH6_9EUPU
MFKPLIRLRVLFNWAALIFTFIFGIHYWLSHKSYVFDEKSLSAISRRHVDIASSIDISTAYSRVLQDLRDKYKGHILPDNDLQWVFMNSGGWMGSMCLLHASLTEYVLFFGTAVDTSGHSGRYWANITDTILTGTFYQWKEGALDRLTFKPGDTVFHAVGEATSVSWTAGTWMVEYGRGFIPSTLFFALADSFTSTLDFPTVFYIIRVYIKALLLEIGYYLGDLRQLIKDSI